MSETMCTVVFNLIWLVYNQLMKVNKLIKSRGSRMERVIFHTLASSYVHVHEYMSSAISACSSQQPASHVDGNETAGCGLSLHIYVLISNHARLSPAGCLADVALMLS